MASRKRLTRPKAKDGELLVKYGRADGETDLLYCWPDNDGGMKYDTKLLMRAFEGDVMLNGKSLRRELEARGYDITTLQFSIKKKDASADTEADK